MSGLCEGSKKATAIITYKGKTTRVESKRPPIDYTVEYSENDSQSNEDVRCDYELTNFLSDGTTGTETFRLDPKKQIYVKTPEEGGVSGSSNYPSFVLYAGEDVISAKYAPDQVSNMTVAFAGNCGGKGWRVKINDASGQIFSKFYPGEEEPKVEVACDDNCPQGQMKCKCDKYPGYCCIPCNSVVPKINNLAAKLRS
ncbi:hypothetical protein BCD64_23280 [Nostoc sp. MBR 210]|nr:hypothetical protein BCD64_23280 [Nostoc sp. MBR 210]